MSIVLVYIFILVFPQTMFSLTSNDILTLNPIGHVYIYTVVKETWFPDGLPLGF